MAIVGNGDIASALTDREDRLYFASGVSNSQETRESEYQREIDLLLAQDKTQHIVYFGSLSIFYADNRYAQHKRTMEALVKEHFKLYTIVRIGNITWGTNPRTIINFFRAKIQRGEPLEIREAYRYVVNKEEFLYWVNMAPEWSCEMNIPGKRMTIKEIVQEYCYINQR